MNRLQTIREKEKQRPRSLVVVAMLLSFAIVLSACGGGNDPATWEEALQEGTLEENFKRSCEQANAGSTLTTPQAVAYCECAFAGLADHFSQDFKAFTDAENRLRRDPNDLDDPVRAILTGCTPQ